MVFGHVVTVSRSVLHWSWYSDHTFKIVHSVGIKWILITKMYGTTSIKFTQENVDKNRFSWMSCSLWLAVTRVFSPSHAFLSDTTVNAVYYRNVLEYCLCAPHYAISDNIPCSHDLLLYMTVLAVILSAQWVMFRRWIRRFWNITILTR
jgi:hypothetical protein